MVRTKDGDGIKSNLIISEVQRRPCLYDTNHPHYGDRSEKAGAWEEIYRAVVPNWLALCQETRFSAGKEVQKRWRSIRDSYTKAYRQGKCVPPEECALGSRRYAYQRQMAFLLRALQNKKPRLSQDKYESVSEVSNSPQHLNEDFALKIKDEVREPLDLKTKQEKAEPPKEIPPEPTKVDKAQQTVEITEPERPREMPVEMKNLEIKIDANAILPEDHFDDDKLFMNSLLPLFKKMDDDTRLLCRIEVLKIIRYALQGHKRFEALRMAEDSFIKTRLNGILAKEDMERMSRGSESTLSMTTRSADGSRPIRKRKIRSPSPLPVPTKKRGPGRPRKVRPPPSDSDEEYSRQRNLKPMPSPRLPELDEEWNKATSVAQLKTPLFMKLYNLERSKNASVLPPINPQSLEVSVKSEPLEPAEQPA